MRTVDKRSRVSRRVFLRGSAAAGLAISARKAWAEEAKALPPHVLASLTLMARDIYPHDHIADSFYIAAVQPWDDKAAADPAFHALMTGGVARLDSDAQDAHGAAYIALPWEEQRVALLQGIEHTPFFKKARSDLVVSLYNQPALWPKLGYEGPSAQLGGYLYRGFDDIDWLPSA